MSKKINFEPLAIKPEESTKEPKAETDLINVRGLVTPELHDKISDLAWFERTTVIEIVSKAVEEYMKDKTPPKRPDTYKRGRGVGTKNNK